LCEIGIIKRMNEGIRQHPVTPEKTAPSIKETEMEILALRDEIYMQGANDSEIGEVNRILDMLRKEEILLGEALRMVHEINNRKQSYH